MRKGPRLRILTTPPDGKEDLDQNSATVQAAKKARDRRAEKIKREWQTWCKRIKFRRKLWTMAHAKIQDGEPIAIVRFNPKVRHRVKLDVCLIETEQCQTPMLPQGVVGYIDGIRFDPWGNPIYYDILPRHPGAVGISWPMTPDRVPAKYVLHWFTCKRPNQHRGVPELTSLLGLGAGHRRFREAVTAGAETIADISLVAQTQGAPEEDGPDQYAPFSAVEFQKRMMMLLPMGWSVFQPKGESPPANYEMFTRASISETGRPKAMPYNLAAADSSQHSFASGKLDCIPYYLTIDDQEREDCNDLVLDPLFGLFWQELVLASQAEGEMLDEDPEEPPEHEWDWPRDPVADSQAEATTNAERLRTGQAAPSDIAHENGESWEAFIRKSARDWGVPEDQVRQTLFAVTFAPKSGGQLQPGSGPDAGGGDEEGAPQRRDGRREGDGGEAGNRVDERLDKLTAVVASLAESVAILAHSAKGG